MSGGMTDSITGSEKCLRDLHTESRQTSQDSLSAGWLAGKPDYPQKLKAGWLAGW